MSFDDNFELKNFFTSDGSELMANYINSLKEYMNKGEIGNEQRISIVNGIYEFIQEYYTSSKEEKISFNTTLSLIEEIGAPTEIVQSLDYKGVNVSTPSIQCPICKMQNSLGSVYCEFCGKKLQSTNKKPDLVPDNEYYPYRIYKTTLKQDFIDHPYSRSFLLFSIVFTGLFTFLSLLFNIWFLSKTNVTVFILANVLFSFLMSLLISSFFSLGTGVIIDSFYKDFKSAKFQYKKILDHFEDNVSAGFGIVFIGTCFYAFFIALGSKIPLLGMGIWITLLALDFIYIVYYERDSFKPQTLSLTQLNLLKLKIDKMNRKKYLNFNTKYFLVFLVAGFLTYILIVPSFSVPLLVILGGLVFTMMYAFIVNGFLIIQLNSWKELSSYPGK